MWEQVLGEPVSSTATTKYFYAFVSSSQSYGGSYLFVHDDGALLTEEEKTNLAEEEWTKEDYAAWLLKYGPISNESP